MTVEEFIHWLQSLNIPNAVVKCYDGDSEQDEEITCVVYDAETISLRTDEP